MKALSRAAALVLDMDFKGLWAAVSKQREKLIQVCLWTTILGFFYAYMQATYTMYKFFDFMYHDAGLVMHGMLSMFHGDYAMEFFNIHFSPVFFLLGPLIKILSIVTQPLLAYAGLHIFASMSVIWLAFAITRHLTGSSLFGLLNSVMLTFNPFFASISASIHFEIVGFAALMAFFYMALRAKHGVALCFLLIGLATKEDVWCYGLFLLFILQGKLERRPQIMYLVTIVAYYVLAIKGLHTNLYPRYGMLASSFNIEGGVVRIILHLLSNLPTTLPNMFNTNALWLVASMGLGFLLGAPIRALSFWALLFLSTNTAHTKMSHLYYYYSWPLVLLGVVLVPFAIVNIKQYLRLPQWYGVALAAIFLLAFGSITRAHRKQVEGIHPIYPSWSRHDADLPSSHRFLHKVFKEHLPTMQGSVMADTNLTPYMADRLTLVVNSDKTFGYPAYEAGKALYTNVLYLLDIHTPYLGREERLAQAEHFRQDARYEIVVDRDSVFYARLKDPSQAIDPTHP